MKNLWIVLISLITFAACEKPLDYVPGEILIAFETTVTNAEAETIVETDLNLTIKEWVTDSPDTKIILVNVLEGEENAQIIAAETHNNIKYAELNHILTID